MQKICKKILDYMIKQGNGCAFEILYVKNLEELASSIKYPIADVGAASEYLCDIGYLSPIIAVSGNHIGFRLSHRGLNYKHFRRNDIIKKCFQYISDKWIDIFALTLSIIALVNSTH